MKKMNEIYLDGIGEGEGDDVPWLHAGGEEARSGTFDEFTEPCMRDIELVGDRDRSPGREFSGDFF